MLSPLTIEFIIQELHGLININHLLNTAIQFKEYKKKLFYWKLNKTNSLKYYHDKDFYNYINSRVFDGNKQLSIDLFGCCYNITDVSCLGNVHTLDLSGGRKITDFSCLGNVYDLNLSNCDNITDECVKHLCNVHTLNLSCCDNITDVSCLGNVYDLDLEGCDNITDVSCLGNVHTLNLYRCDNITVVSLMSIS